MFVIHLSSKVGISEELLFLELYIGVFWIMTPCSLVRWLPTFRKKLLRVYFGGVNRHGLPVILHSGWCVAAT